jgi:hypothetical protein
MYSFLMLNSIYLPPTLRLPSDAKPLTELVQRAAFPLLLNVYLPHSGLLADALSLRSPLNLLNSLKPKRVPL